MTSLSSLYEMDLNITIGENDFKEEHKNMSHNYSDSSPLQKEEEHFSKNNSAKSVGSDIEMYGPSSQKNISSFKGGDLSSSK